ncbi:MAG: LemA family protein [Planctomycetota bacterium]|jgi:LemA protein
MSRIGAVVKRLYGDQVNPVYDNSGKDMAPKFGRRENAWARFKSALHNRRVLIWAVKIIVVLGILFVAAESVFQYNRLATCHTTVGARRADVEREYQRRYNLIPNLVFAVGKYATYEQSVFKDVSEARSELMKMQSSGLSQSEMSNLLEKALSRIIAWSEQYPDLKATQSVQDLIMEASNTEDRVADAKKEYNKSCEIYNQFISVFPGNVFAFIYRFRFVDYIGLKEEEVDIPVIDLNIARAETVTEADTEVPAASGNITE